MKYKPLFHLVLKTIGAFVAIRGVSSLARFSMWPVGLFSGADFHTGGILAFMSSALGPIVETAIGLYLLLDGRWVLNKAIPSNRPYCPGSAYDLTGVAGPRCSECGTPFRWEDVKPRGENQAAEDERRAPDGPASWHAYTACR